MNAVNYPFLLDSYFEWKDNGRQLVSRNFLIHNLFQLFFILTETNIIIYLLEKVPVNHGNLERLSCYKFQRIQPELEVIQEETCTNVQIEEKMKVNKKMILN